MGFTQARKDFLISKGVSTELIGQWEKNTEELGKSLKDYGVSFKSVLEDGEGDVQIATEVVGLVKAFGEFTSSVTTELTSLRASIDEAKTLAQKSKDDILSEEYIAKVSGVLATKGFQASTAESTAVIGEKENQPKSDWMDEKVFNGLFGASTPTS